ncbi:MAG: 16S rRNA (guanine(966)-N(2))-methyltransferase RsmD [Rhodoferax sp.]|mgnify:FL=1|nr:16S rRNA (guanine(966)-N(2))-methyltransferase RsmD [Rhodoferax sp.]
MKQKKSELPRKPRVPRHATPLANEIRIIGGQWKRTKLAVADRPGLRPTPDRVRETLFNWLGQDLTGWRCVDVFAGTGVLGFEAASRGAKEVQLVELDTALVAQLKRTQIQLKANATQVVRGDGVVTLKQMDPGSMDVIFIDPPFDSTLFEPALAAAGRVVAPDGFIYLEAPLLWSDEKLKDMGLTVHRHLKAGAVHAHILKKVASLPVTASL